MKNKKETENHEYDSAMMWDRGYKVLNGEIKASVTEKKFYLSIRKRLDRQQAAFLRKVRSHVPKFARVK